MAYVIELQHDEEVLLDTRYLASRGAPFAFAVTNHALFVPAVERWKLTTDPYFYRRVPLSEVREVRIERLAPLLLQLLAILMIVSGLTLSLLGCKQELGRDATSDMPNTPVSACGAR